MTPGALFSLKRAGAVALGPPGSGGPSPQSFVSVWFPWWEIATFTVRDASSEKFEEGWISRFRSSHPIPSRIMLTCFWSFLADGKSLSPQGSRDVPQSGVAFHLLT